MPIPKYELTDEWIDVGGVTVYKIKALKAFKSQDVDVVVGSTGGYVQGYHNLSQDGNCWVDYQSIVRENARVEGDAIVSGHVHISEQAVVSGRALVLGNRISLTGNCLITENAEVINIATISGRAVIRGKSQIANGPTILGSSIISGNSLIDGPIVVSGDSTIIGDTMIDMGFRETGDSFKLPPGANLVDAIVNNEKGVFTTKVGSKTLTLFCNSQNEYVFTIGDVCQVLNDKNLASSIPDHEKRQDVWDEIVTHKLLDGGQN